MSPQLLDAWPALAGGRHSCVRRPNWRGRVRGSHAIHVGLVAEVRRDRVGMVALVNLAVLLVLPIGDQGAHGMPPAIAARFTQGEAAVLATVAAEASSHGDCRLTVGHVAAIAGVCQSTVRNALREAVKLGLVTIEERRVRAFRNRPNIVRVVSPAWLAWMRLGRQGGGYKSVNPTNTRSCLSSSGAAFPLGKRLGDKARGDGRGYSASCGRRPPHSGGPAGSKGARHL
jgi:hypothetical protein